MAVRAGLASIAALLLASTALTHAHAQDENAESQPVYIEADTMSENRETGAYFARGNVEARQGDRTVTADELEYRPATGRVIARGNVTIYSADAQPQYADEVELDNQMGSGIATGFSTYLENNGRAAAAYAVRRPSGTLELRDAYYTACPLCSESGRAPSWRLRAERVVQDKDDQMVYYENVRLEAAGIPVFYSPYFAHPDPSSERRSGFLPPVVGLSSRLGFSYQQPYYWAISPYQDVTIAPRFMTNVRPLILGEYRKRFYSGRVGFEGSIAYDREIGNDGERFGDEDLRYHLFGGGEFELAERWEWGFGVQAASDDLHFRRYDINEQFTGFPGLIQSPLGRLTSQLYVRGQGENFYTESYAAAFQSLLIGANDDFLPVIAPSLEYMVTQDLGDMAGILRGTANLVSLTRDDWIDYRRASAELDWTTRWISPNGIVLSPFAQARGDYYHIEDIPGATPADPLETDSFGRGLALAGAQLSWPFLNQTPGGGSVIVEPMVQFVSASSSDDTNGRIPNEDSQNVDLTQSVLFAANRAPGYDVWEEGSRLTYGINALANFANGTRLTGFLGQSQRLSGDPVFAPGSGLNNEASDIVADLSYFSDNIQFRALTRFDPEEGELNRISTGLNAVLGDVTLGFGYGRYSDAQVVGGPRQEAQLVFAWRFHENWGVGYEVTRDLESDISRMQTASLNYVDDCTIVSLIYSRDNYSYGILGPSDSLQLRVTLFTLGAVGSDD